MVTNRDLHITTERSDTMMVSPVSVPSNPLEALVRAISTMLCTLSSGGGCAVIQ
ncbi:hypothetical protein [Nocardia otitidiscaviarum]|uniref:hypothetical protein n=1 Tax=Nocardia otitidiscaviarum TaxID=1823 RepID=UPI001E36E94B|nr:hypothetical protein [Nocardia otitidiscaviarum]